MVNAPTLDEVVAAVGGVLDPEIPVLTLADMGIVRDVAWDGTTAQVTITPTYSGCPAMDAIREDITAALRRRGVVDVRVETVLSPAWTTDWITPEGRRKLTEYGIAPPRFLADAERLPILCPRCSGEHSRVVSAFGSTACKALMVCSSCAEPFDHFKEL